MQQQPARVVSPIGPVGGSGEGTHAPYHRLCSCSTDGQARTGSESDCPDAAHLHSDLVAVAQV